MTAEKHKHQLCLRKTTLEKYCFHLQNQALDAQKIVSEYAIECRRIFIVEICVRKRSYKNVIANLEGGFLVFQFL
jgi:hypothetical protein